MVVIHVALPLHFFLANTVSFVPMHLSTAYPPIGQAYQGNAFPFTLTPSAVLLAQAHDVTDGRPNCDGFNVGDVSNNFKMHQRALYQLRA
jgi:hypothetical protein